jgi:hypothetical protein
MKNLTRALAALAFLAVAAPVQAEVYTEDFNAADFNAWKSGWFGQNSNAKSIDPFAIDRGNNVTGLTLFDGNIDDGRQINFLFNADFGATITNFSFDLLNYTSGLAQTMRVFDIAGNTLFETILDVVAQDPLADNGSNNGYDFADSKYTRYSINSTNGIGGFSVLPFGSEGNLSIDDLQVTTASVAAVPEPASWAMMIGGLGLVGAMLRRRQTKTVFA